MNWPDSNWFREWLRLARHSAFVVALFAIAATLSAASIIVSWDANPADEQVASYTVYQSATVAGPWVAVTNVSGTNVTLSLASGKYFFYVTASNFWGESAPSNTAGTPPPASKVSGPKVAK